MSITTNGSYLYAKCEDVNGAWHAAQIDTSRCPGSMIANNNSALVCGRGGYGISKTLPRGSWRASCKDASKSGGVLYAQCDTGSGTWHSTSLDVDTCPERIVGNSRGNLVCTNGVGNGGVGGSLPGGTWQSTCRNGNVRDSIFYAQCNTGESSSWHDSSLNLNTCPGRLVGNTGGNLVCQRGANGGSNGGYNPSTLPPGSWRTTCRNGRLNGSMLYAECFDGAGTWRQASFDLRGCRGSLGNNHGVLYCTSGGMYRRLQ